MTFTNSQHGRRDIYIESMSLKEVELIQYSCHAERPPASPESRFRVQLVDSNAKEILCLEKQRVEDWKNG